MAHLYELYGGADASLRRVWELGVNRVPVEHAIMAVVAELNVSVLIVATDVEVNVVVVVEVTLVVVVEPNVAVVVTADSFTLE